MGDRRWEIGRARRSALQDRISRPGHGSQPIDCACRTKGIKGKPTTCGKLNALGGGGRKSNANGDGSGGNVLCQQILSGSVSDCGGNLGGIGGRHGTKAGG